MTGDEQISAERNRQILEKGFLSSADDEYKSGELILAAIGYATKAVPRFDQIDVWSGIATNIDATHTPPAWWPWDESWWKPSTNPIDNLVKAGALIAAEIDRLRRVQRDQ